MLLSSALRKGTTLWLFVQLITTKRSDERLHESTRVSMREYRGAHNDATLRNPARDMTTLPKQQEGSKSSTTYGNDHVDTRKRHEELIPYPTKDNVAPHMSVEQNSGSVSSSSSSRKATKRSERCKSQNLSHTRQHRNRLGVALVIH